MIGYLLPRPLDRADPGSLRGLGVTAALASAGEKTAVLAPPGRGSVDPSLQRLLVPGIELPPTDGMSTAAAVAELGITSLIGHGADDGLLAEMASSGLPADRRIVDVVDWHPPDPGAAAGGRAMKPDLIAAGSFAGASALVVSRFMAEHLTGCGVRTLRVPPLFSRAIRAEVEPLNRDGRLHVVFAGQAGRLDVQTIRNVLLAAAELNAEGQRVVVHLVGPGHKIVAAVAGVGPTALAGAVFHGPLDHLATTRLVAGADFVVLQRPGEQRWVRAGFPSKVVEGWILGTPVISNEVSDLGEYLHDGVNAVVLADESLSAMADGLRRAVHRAGDFDRARIRLWAEERFAPRVFGEALRGFVTPEV